LLGLKTYIPLLNKISKERILKELETIVVADYKLNRKNDIFLKVCNHIGLIKYLFNSTLQRVGKFTKKEFESFYSLSKDSRLIGFYILVLKKYFIGYAQNNQIGYNINSILGINGIKESSSHISTVEKIYRVYQNLEYDIDTLNASINYLTFSDAEREIIDSFVSLKGKQNLELTIQMVKKYNLPLSVHQLDITPQDLIDLNIDNIYISKILSTLYNQVLSMAVKNSNEDLKNLALEIHKTFKNI
jgi:hypothetical protein